MMEMGTRPASQEATLTGLHGSNRGDAWGGINRSLATLKCAAFAGSKSSSAAMS